MKCLSFVYLALILAFASFVRTEFIYSCKEKKTIALTFDDGPHKYTKDFVDYLVDEHPDVKVTFFHVGRFHYPFAIDVKEYQKAMKKAHDNGLQIASHTYEHKIPADKDEFKKALTKMDDFIEKVTGDRPRYFRAPKGHCEKECQAALDEWDYRLIQWDTDTNDWDLETSGSVEQRIEDSISFLKKKFAQKKDSYLILMHDSQNYTVNDIAPWIIEKSGMKEKGYKFVTVAECLGDKKGMYRSGETIDNNQKLAINPGNTTTTTITTSLPTTTTDITTATNIIAGNIEHKLDSGAMSTKPMAIISYIILGLMSVLIYVMN